MALGYDQTLEGNNLSGDQNTIFAGKYLGKLSRCLGFGEEPEFTKRRSRESESRTSEGSQMSTYLV